MAIIIDSNYVPLKESKDKASIPYLYPQTLVKQLKLNKQPKYKKNDFILVINNCNSMPEYRDNELRSILIHELLHGLGFMSLTSVIELKNDDGYSIDSAGISLEFDMNKKYAIFPNSMLSLNEKLLEITEEEEYMNQLYDSNSSKPLPFSVFDKNIVSLESGKKIFDDLKSYYKEVNEKCLPKDGSTNKYSSDCFKKLSAKTQKTITNIIKENYFILHTLGILTVDGNVVPLQTMNGTYSSISSVSHPNNPLIDEIYSVPEEERQNFLNEIIDFTIGTLKKEALIKYYDDNYVLYYFDNDNLTVEEMIELLPNNPTHPLIGDGIFNVMKTLGWNGKGDKKSNKIYYLDETFDIPEANSFEYVLKKKYEISHHNKTPSTETETEIENEKPTSTVDEMETTLPDESSSEVEVDAENVLPLEDVSDSDFELNSDSE